MATTVQVVCFVALLQLVTGGKDKDPCISYPECSNIPNIHLPDCSPNAKKTALLECSETNVDNVKNCKVFVQRTLKNFAAGVKLAEKTLCDAPGMRQEFESQTKCWRGAVTCVAGYLGSSPGQDHTPDQCKTSVSSANQCTDQRNPACHPLQRRFLDYAVARTSCHAYTSHSQKTTSSFMVLVITLMEAVRRALMA